MYTDSLFQLPIIPNRVRSQSFTNATTEHFQEQVRRIANNSYRLRIRDDSHPGEEYSAIIQQSQSLFESVNSTRESSLYPTALPEMQVSNKISRQHIIDKKQKRNNDISSLNKVMQHYENQFKINFHIEESKQQNQQRNLNRWKKQWHLSNANRYRRIQEETAETQRIQQNFIKQAEKEKMKKLIDKSHSLFQQPLVLIVIDLLQTDIRNAIFGINIGIYHRCTFHKSMEKIFDGEIYDTVYPYLQQIKEKGLQNLRVRESVSARCEEIRSKIDFLSYLKKLKEKNFNEILIESIIYLFIPNKLYRLQLVKDMIEQINQLIIAEEQVARINNLCTLRGDCITDFFQIEWDTKALLGYSDNQVMLQNLPILESLLQVAKDKLKISFKPIERRQSNLAGSFNPRLSLKKAVELIKDDPSRASEKYDETLPINMFLNRMKLKQSKEEILAKRQPGKTMIVEGQQIGCQNKQKLDFLEYILQFFLTPMELQILIKENPNLLTETIIQYFEDFKQLISQNEYYEIKKSLSKQQKLVEDNRYTQTYVQLLVEQRPQLKRRNLERIIKACIQKNSIDFISIQMDWLQYLNFRMIIDGQASEKVSSNFLRYYFDEHHKRWILMEELEQIIKEIPSPKYPESFRVMFVSLIINWFKDMNLIHEEKMFDTNQFSMAAEQNIILLRYLISWIIGEYDIVDQSPKHQQNNSIREVPQFIQTQKENQII